MILLFFLLSRLLHVSLLPSEPFRRKHIATWINKKATCYLWQIGKNRGFYLTISGMSCSHNTMGLERSGCLTADICVLASTISGAAFISLSTISFFFFFLAASSYKKNRLAFQLLNLSVLKFQLIICYYTCCAVRAGLHGRCQTCSNKVYPMLSIRICHCQAPKREKNNNN